MHSGIEGFGSDLSLVTRDRRVGIELTRWTRAKEIGNTMMNAAQLEITAPAADTLIA